MLILVVTTLLLMLSAAIMGFVLAPLITFWLRREEGNRGPVVLAISIGIGFAFSAIAATWSFGAIGANSYLMLLIVLSILSTSLLLNSHVRAHIRIWKEFLRSDIFLFLIPIYVSILSLPYWKGLFKLQVSAGNGPDIPQNIMTALAQQNVGSTWSEGKENFLEAVGSTNLNEGIYHIYQLPSMQLQAGFDYLVYGTRWGLSIPYAQVLRIDRTWIGAEQGVVITAGLAALAFVIYGALTLFKANKIIAHLLAFASVSSACLLFQIFNGGLAQVWSLVGIGLISMAFLAAILLATSEKWEKNSYKGVIAVFTLGWISNAVTYIDSSMSLAVALFLSSAVISIFVSKKIGFRLVKLLTVSGLLAALIVLPFTIAAASTLSLRLRMAAGTGLIFNHWPLPSEILGIFNIWTGQPGQPRDNFGLLLSVLFSLYLISIFTRKLTSKDKSERAFGIVGVSVFVICGSVALWAKNTSLGSNYSFVKISTYLTPLILMLYGFYFHGQAKSKSSEKRVRQYARFSSIAFVLTIVLAIGTTAGLTNKQLLNEASFTTSMEQMNIHTDIEAQKELSDFNYLTTYFAVSNLLGMLGDVHWVGKAPNDQLLDDRLDIPMRIICLVQDKACNPPGAEIQPSTLNKYGYRVFNSVVTSREFAALSARERYQASFKAVGQAPIDIPERFIGGNPLLKDGK
jgi:hypothetical protein